MARINGTGRADFLIGTERADIIDGRGGNDELFGLGGNDLVRGGEGIDIIYSGEGADTLLGGAGGDFLVDGPGIDVFDGGAGIDGLYFSFFGVSGAGRVEIDLAAGRALTASGSETVRGIEVVVAGDRDDVVRGDAGANRFRGGGGSDEIRGRGGDDHIDGEAGDDRLFGGPGADHFSSDPGDDVLTGGSGSDTVNKYARDFDGDDTVLDFRAEDQLALILPSSGGRYHYAGAEQVDTDGDGTLNDGDAAIAITDVTFGGETRASTVIDLGALTGHRPGTESTLTLFGTTGLGTDVLFQ